MLEPSMIEKPSILVTSLGRTGTEFFARFFGQVFPDATSLHEPDIFQYTGVDNRLAHYLGQVGRAGLWRMGFLKAVGRWTLVKISDERFLERIDSEQARSRLERQRRSFIREMPGSIYVEANIGYYGLLDVLPQIFRHHRAAFFVRDGRDWVRSHMNWGELYGKRGLRKLISHHWPTAAEVPGDALGERWTRLSRFEKLCWAWTRLNQYALDTLSANPNARVFRFEDIFSEKPEPLAELLEFLTALPGIAPISVENACALLKKPSHQSSKEFPAWTGWAREQQRHFEHVCSPMMDRLAYRY
jgi:hypothetical protein